MYQTTMQGEGPKGPRSGLEARGTCVGYRVKDPRGREIGRVGGLYLNWDGEPEYVEKTMGLFGTKTVLLPVVAVEVDEARRTLVLQ